MKVKMSESKAEMARTMFRSGIPTHVICRKLKVTWLSVYNATKGIPDSKRKVDFSKDGLYGMEEVKYN